MKIKISEQVKRIITPKVSKSKLATHLNIDRVTLWRKIKNNSFSDREVSAMKCFGVQK